MAYASLELVYGNARDEAHLHVCRILLDFLILEFSADEMFEELMMACHFAGRPTKCSLCFVTAKMDSVV